MDWHGDVQMKKIYNGKSAPNFGARQKKTKTSGRDNLSHTHTHSRASAYTLRTDKAAQKSLP